MCTHVCLLVAMPVYEASAVIAQVHPSIPTSVLRRMLVYLGVWGVMPRCLGVQMLVLLTLPSTLPCYYDVMPRYQPHGVGAQLIIVYT